jgi:hypothetical protein
MKYKLTDQMGTVIAQGNQLDFKITVDLDNQTMTVLSGANNTVCDIAGGDKFLLTFTRE